MNDWLLIEFIRLDWCTESWYVSNGFKHEIES